MQGRQGIKEITEIEFKEVAFAYDEKKENTLEQISFKLKSGGKYAFVGEVGCGKSTILQLINGQLRPLRGKILVNGKDLQEINLHDYWKLIGYVPQEPYVFNDTVEENIVLGESAHVNKVPEILNQVNLAKEVNELKEGIKTQVGLRGTSISGGQAQRLAVARTFAQDVHMYVWDDCFSSLDSKNELHIWRSLKSRLHNQICVLATHRLGTVANFDEVFVLAGGKIAERGAPANLAQQDGIYKSLL